MEIGWMLSLRGLLNEIPDDSVEKNETGINEQDDF